MTLDLSSNDVPELPVGPYLTKLELLHIEFGDKLTVLSKALRHATQLRYLVLHRNDKKLWKILQTPMLLSACCRIMDTRREQPCAILLGDDVRLWPFQDFGRLPGGYMPDHISRLW